MALLNDSAFFYMNRGDSARTMTKFAAAMMRTLAALKAKSEPKMPDFQLRIGKTFTCLDSYKC
jgi:hypothetical protein